MATAKLRYITRDRDRHGNVRRYFRPTRDGTKTRLAEPFQSEAFWRHYAACLEAHAKGEPIPPAPSSSGSAQPPAREQITAGTWRWLCAQYFASPAFKAFDRISQRTRRGILEATCLEPIAPGDKRTFGEMPIKHFGRRAVVVLRDRKAATPGAANNRIKSIRAVFKWAMESALPGIDENPARDVPKLQVDGGGFHSWTREEVEQYRAHHAIGTTPRLALEMLLLLGVRRSDVVKIGRPHVRDGWIRFRPTKGQARAPQLLELPILPELEAVLAATQTGELTFLANKRGRPYSVEGFGNVFRDWCNAAGLPHCSAHGLRKAGATIAAENGADPYTLMSIFGWRTLSEPVRYTRAVEQKKLAGKGMRLLVSQDPKGGTHASGKPRKPAE